jgi:hypothetical protein
VVSRALVDEVRRETEDDGSEDPLRGAQDNGEKTCEEHVGGGYRFGNNSQYAQCNAGRVLLGCGCGM